MNLKPGDRVVSKISNTKGWVDRPIGGYCYVVWDDGRNCCELNDILIKITYDPNDLFKKIL